MAARSCVLLSVFLYLAPCHVHIKDIPHSSLHTSSTSAQGSIGWSIATISWIKIRCPELHIWRRGGTARWLSHHPLIRNYPWRFRSLWTRPKHASRSACSIVGCSQLVSSQKMTPYTQPDQSTTHETEVTDIRTPGITQMVVRRNLCFIANDDHIKYHPLLPANTLNSQRARIRVCWHQSLWSKQAGRRLAKVQEQPAFIEKVTSD